MFFQNSYSGIAETVLSAFLNLCTIYMLQFKALSGDQ